MEPLSSRKRRLYLSVLIVTFFFMLPLTLLYSAGYRLGEHFTIVKTGGIYLGLNESGASLYLDGEFVREAGILKRGFFVQDLKPGSYHIAVQKDGFSEWEKTLIVDPQRVVEASAFIFPREMTFEEIPQFVEGVGGSSRRVPNTEYESAAALFATTTTPSRAAAPLLVAAGIATTSDMHLYRDIERKGNIVLWRKGGVLSAAWIGDQSSAPLYFCNATEACTRQIVVNDEAVRHADFYANTNEFVVLALPEGIFVREIDDRSTRNTAVLYSGANADFRIIGNTLFVKDGSAILRAAL